MLDHTKCGISTPIFSCEPCRASFVEQVRLSEEIISELIAEEVSNNPNLRRKPMSLKISFALMDCKDVEGPVSLSFDDIRLNLHNVSLRYQIEREYLANLEKLQAKLVKKYSNQIDQANDLTEDEEQMDDDDDGIDEKFDIIIEKIDAKFPITTPLYNFFYS